MLEEWLTKHNHTVFIFDWFEIAVWIIICMIRFTNNWLMQHVSLFLLKSRVVTWVTSALVKYRRQLFLPLILLFNTNFLRMHQIMKTIIQWIKARIDVQLNKICLFCILINMYFLYWIFVSITNMFFSITYHATLCKDRLQLIIIQVDSVVMIHLPSMLCIGIGYTLTIYKDFFVYKWID